MEFDHRTRRDRAATATVTDALGPGKYTLTEQLPVQHREASGKPTAIACESRPFTSGAARAPSADPRPTLQMLFGVPRAAPDARAEDPAQVHAAAARGTGAPVAKLPYADQIQRSFGRHDISGIQAHVGGEASASAQEMGARAYATGGHVVLGEGADLHTVAHEAAHVVQQRAGVHLSGGVGQVGDRYEQQADAVADGVVQGKSVQSLLDQCSGAPLASAGRAPAANTQRQEAPAHSPGTEAPAAKTSTRFLVDEGSAPGKMGKEAFLAALESRIRSAANEVLAEIGQKADDCPYIVRWFGYYSAKDPAHIEQAIARFAPASAAATTVDQYIHAIVEKTRHALQDHVKTGSVDEVPAEILGARPQPTDFLHLRPGATGKPVAKQVQRSCLCGDGGAGQHGNQGYNQLQQPPQQPPQQPIEQHSLSQGETAVAHVGARVFNVSVTSCGLVLGFGDDGVGCFHWPFMTNSPEHHGTFNGIIGGIGTLQCIEIITNDFPTQNEIAHYVATARAIRDQHGVPTTYHVVDGQITGDFWGTLAQDHLNSTSALRLVNL